MGGSLSFGMIGEASAPGQIDVTQLKQFLKLFNLHLNKTGNMS
jgi:3-dehydroquinate dehydratase